MTELSPDDVGHGWDEFVERHPEGSVFHLTAWRDLVRRHFPHRPRYLEARDGGRRVGVLPLFETRSLLSGKALVSVPYGVYGGPLAASEAALAALLGRARELVASGAYRYAEFRSRSSVPLATAGSQRYATFVRELPADPEACLGMIPRKSRATARQALERHGLEIVEDPAALDAFHELFVLNKQRLGSPAFSRSYFSTLLARPRLSRLHVVHRNGRPLLGVLSLAFRDTLNPYYSGATAEADRLGAANFAYWQLMRVAAREGFRYFDFGRSRVDTGPYHFKRNMGFEPTELPYSFLLGPGRSLPRVSPSNPAFSLPQEIIRRMPVGLAKVAGPLLLRLVP